MKAVSSLLVVGWLCASSNAWVIIPASKPALHSRFSTRTLPLPDGRYVLPFLVGRLYWIRVGVRLDDSGEKTTISLRYLLTHLPHRLLPTENWRSTLRSKLRPRSDETTATTTTAPVARSATTTATIATVPVARSATTTATIATAPVARSATCPLLETVVELVEAVEAGLVEADLVEAGLVEVEVKTVVHSTTMVRPL